MPFFRRMAPMTFAQVRDTQGLYIFEDHILRHIILFFTRSAYDASKLDYEEKFLTLQRRISRSRSTSQRYNNISSLAKLIWRFIIETKMDVRLRSVSRLPGLHEFCHCLLSHPWLRKQWEPIILSCTCEFWSTWIEKGPCRPDFTIQKIATEQWEWSCFRHYRDSFRFWALHGNPCKECADKLGVMTRNVEYDRIEVALRHHNSTIPFLRCLSGASIQTRYIIPSLEPFIMVLKQAKNTGWLAWWTPLIHMHTGFTVDEIYQTYLQGSRERDAIEGSTTGPNRIAGTMFEHRDLQHVVENVQGERTSVEHRLAIYRRRPNDTNEEAQVVPAVNRG